MPARRDRAGIPREGEWALRCFRVLELVLAERFKEWFLKDKFFLSNHARLRMFQRNISTSDIREVMAHGEIIEDYPDDEGRGNWGCDAFKLLKLFWLNAFQWFSRSPSCTTTIKKSYQKKLS